MAVYGQDINFASALQQRSQNREQEFYGGLLQTAMQSGGQFDVEEGKPVYSSTNMPEKTEVWNEFIKMKRGRIGPQDIQQFEAAWTQAQQLRSSKQLEELGKLKLRGFNDREIKKSIETSPALYGSLIDMITNLESSGDENAFAQAQTIRGMMPTVDTGGLLGEMYDEPGFGSSIAAPATILSAVALQKYLTTPNADSSQAIAQAKSDKKDISAQRRAITKDMKNISMKPSDKAINEAKRNLNINKLALEDELKKNVAQRNDAKVKKLQAEQLNLESKLKKARTSILPENQKKMDDLKAKQKSLGADLKAANKIISDKPLTKAQQLVKSYNKLGKFGKFGVQSAGFAGLSGLRPAGKYLGGDTGEFVGRNLSNLGMLGMSLRAGYAAPLLAAAPIMDIYSQFKGE